MAAGKGVDLLMKFRTGGSYVEAESTDSLGLEKFSQDPLLKGFEQGKTFEVFDFSFGTGVTIGDDDSDDEKNLKQDLSDAKAMKPPNPGQVRSIQKKLDRHKKAKGRTWTFGNDFPVEIQPVSFSRSIDKASSTLLQRCFDSQYFDSVTLVKRRSVGGPFSGYGYLRMDFGGVMLNQISWSEDDEVKETCTFVCRSVLIQYRPVLPNGELGAPKSGNWEAPGVPPVTAI